MNIASELSRRDFLKTSALAGGGLVIGFAIPVVGRFAQAQQALAAAASAFAPNAFLRIASDDSITVLLAHSEMGQGIWTALPMLIAEELDADWSKIRVEHAPADPAYHHTGFGRQMTGASSSTWSEMDRYRQAGASARALLVQAAAARFGVPLERIRTDNGEVIADAHRVRYGALADDAGRLEPPDPASLKLKDARDWKWIGKPTRRLDTPEKITGRAQYGMDVQFDGLLTAVVARSPVFGGQVRSFDASAARRVPGVRHVLQVPSGVAVVADHYWAATLGRAALKVEWIQGEQTPLDSQRLREEFGRLAATPGLSVAQAGNVAVALRKAVKTVAATYAVPYLAHAPMEPLNCTVRIERDRCDLWTGTHQQSRAQATAAEITALAPEQVFVHTPLLGGSFGRRLAMDFIAEAVHVAKAANAPVKTMWSREDDLHSGYYRSAFVHDARIGLDAQSRPMAWQHGIAGQSIRAGTPLEPKNGIDHSSIEGVADSPYVLQVPDHYVGLHSPRTAVRVLWWRSVGHSHSGFVMESLVDELAHVAGQDPVEYRRALLQQHPRHLGVLDLAVEKSGWSMPPAQGRARGVAVHASFRSYAAQVAEVSIADDPVHGRAIRVHRVICALDCGIAINPLAIRAQIESAIAYGLSAALYDGLSFKDGRVQQSNFHDYKVLRMAAMPQVDVHIVPSTEPPGGVGEPGVPPVAAAVANAVFALTGQRLRELPLRLSGRPPAEHENAAMSPQHEGGFHGRRDALFPA